MIRLGTARGRETLVIAGFVLALAFAQDGVRRISSDASALVPPPPPFLGLSVDARVVRRLLGVRLVVADFIWIDTLIKGDIVHEREPYTPMYRAFKTIVALDPDNLYAYYVGGLYLSVIKDDVKGASALMREGVRYMESNPYHWPGAWNLPYLLGYNLLFEENEIEEGSQWIRKAAEMPNVPLYVRRVADRVSTEEGRLEVASRVLADLHRRMSRAEEKALIEKKMVDLAAKQELLELNKKFTDFQASTGAYALPKNKQFQLFVRSIGHPRKDILGRPIGLSSAGKIVTLQPGQ